MVQIAQRSEGMSGEHDFHGRFVRSAAQAREMTYEEVVEDLRPAQASADAAEFMGRLRALLQENGE